MSKWDLDLEAEQEVEQVPVERRRATRHRCSLKVTWRLFSRTDDSSWWSMVQDLSTTGIRLVLWKQLKTGTILEVCFQRPGDDRLSAPHLMRVRRVSRQAGGSWLTGCAFVKARSEGEVQAFLKAGAKAHKRRSEPSEKENAKPPSDPFLGIACEKRRTPRRLGGPVTVQLLHQRSASLPVEGWVLDRSAGGVSVSVGRPYPRGIKLRIRPVHYGKPAAWVQVTVRSCRPDDNRWAVGCEFADELPSTLLQLFG